MRTGFTGNAPPVITSMPRPIPFRHGRLRTAASSIRFFHCLQDRATTGAKALEDYLEWKFSAYGRLWNSTRETLGGIARLAPELSGLWWWFDGGRYDDADIAFDGYPIPPYFAQPQIRVFTDSTGTDCYLFYVNRFCRANNNPFEITVDAVDFPSGTPFSEYALDHSRRFLIEGGMIARDVYAFRDTLDAGEARLLQVFDDEEGLDADVRITDPDLSVILPHGNDTLLDARSVPGESRGYPCPVLQHGNRTEEQRQGVSC